MAEEELADYEEEPEVQEGKESKDVKKWVVKLSEH